MKPDLIRKNLTLFGLLGIFIASSVLLEAADIQVTSAFSKRNARVGEEIQLTIQIEGASGNVQAPRLPGFDGFDTFYTGRSSRITFINGVQSSTVEFSYVLVPRKPGKFRLEPITAVVDGRAFRTSPIDIEITDAMAGTPQTAVSKPSPAQAPSVPYIPPASPAAQPQVLVDPSSYNPQDENIFVQAVVDKQTVYSNEQVLLTYWLYTSYDTRYEGFKEEPEVSGFWIEEFPPERDIRKETVRVNGKRYIKAEIKKVALFPTAPADYTIQPGSINVSIRQDPQQSGIFDEFFNDSFFSGGSFFSRRENRLLKAQPLHVKVLPLPEEGKPGSFQGAVGNFRLSSSVDKTEVKQNDPVTLKLVIEGEGNIETLNKPVVPESRDFKIYDADSSSELFKTGTVIGGRKTFEIVFIPVEAGTLEIPSLEFSFFSPQVKAYRVLRTNSYTLKVEASKESFDLPQDLSRSPVFKKEVRRESRDILYIWENLPGDRGRVIFGALLNLLTVANGLLAILLFYGIIRNRREAFYAKNKGLRRKRFARVNAEARMRKIKRLSKGSDSEKGRLYFEEVEKILTQYLADKFDESVYGITRYDLEMKLEHVLGREHPLCRDIVALYQLCDEFRYGKGDIPHEKKNKAWKILGDAVKHFEKVMR